MANLNHLSRGFKIPADIDVVRHYPLFVMDMGVRLLLSTLFTFPLARMRSAIRTEWSGRIKPN
jgi:hypothetical protein